MTDAEINAALERAEKGIVGHESCDPDCCEMAASNHGWPRALRDLQRARALLARVADAEVLDIPKHDQVELLIDRETWDAVRKVKDALKAYSSGSA